MLLTPIGNDHDKDFNHCLPIEHSPLTIAYSPLRIHHCPFTIAHNATQ
jgi:hypothetical protein